MLGAIIGDIVGSVYEFNNIKTKEFELFSNKSFFTDDSVMTVALMNALLEWDNDFSNLSKLSIKYMQKYGRKYPDCSYGGNFYEWLHKENPKPYNSWGNGSAMRVSAVAYCAKNLEEVKKLSKLVTEVTHNHKEGLKGAEATAVAIYLARIGQTKKDIKEYIYKNYYQIDFELDDIRDTYEFDESCQGTVPYALEAFFESNNFEDAIRNAISIGGDSDTLAAITGSLAEAYYGIPQDIREIAISFLPYDLFKVVKTFEEKYSCNNEFLIKKLVMLREIKNKIDTSRPFDHGFAVGWDEAFNYTFALLGSKKNILCEQGYHPEQYIKRIRRIIK